MPTTALLLGSREHELDRLVANLARHGVEIGTHRTKNNATASIPEDVDLVIHMKDLNGVPTLAQLVKRNARRRGMPFVSIPHRWSTAGKALTRAGFPEVRVRKAKKKKQIVPLSPTAMEIAMTRAQKTPKTPMTTYAWVLAHLARNMWASNTDIAEAGQRWARKRDRAFPATVHSHALQAREALGIVRLERRARGRKRAITLDAERYEAMCASLNVEPRYGKNVTLLGDPKDAAPPTKTARAPKVTDWTHYGDCPVCGAHTGIACRFGKAGDLGGSDRGLAHDDRLMAEGNGRAEAVSTRRTPTPTSTVLDVEEAVQSLAELAWDVMARHGLLVLTITSDGIDYEAEIRTTVTRSLSRGTS